MQQHFVTFYSPGTFFAETNEKPIDSWDVKKAMKMAHSIYQRYGATPYGFRFTTRSRTSKDLDSKVSKTSNMYYLGGKVETIADVEKRDDPKEKILLSNMKCNHCEKIITNNNSWEWTQPLEKTDVILDFTPKKKERKVR